MIFSLFFAFGVSFLCCTYFITSFFILQDGILYKLNSFILYKDEKLGIYHKFPLTTSLSFAILNMLGGLHAGPFFITGGKRI